MKTVVYIESIEELLVLLKPRSEDCAAQGLPVFPRDKAVLKIDRDDNLTLHNAQPYELEPGPWSGYGLMMSVMKTWGIKVACELSRKEKGGVQCV